MTNLEYGAYRNAEPYFALVRNALGDLVDGAHFFDVVAEDVIYEVLYEFPGWPRFVRGRANLMSQFLGYCAGMELRSADNLVIHKADDGHVIVLEYEVHGRAASNQASYNNRFASIVKLHKRKIVYWRDYMDSLAAWNTLTA